MAPVTKNRKPTEYRSAAQRGSKRKPGRPPSPERLELVQTKAKERDLIARWLAARTLKTKLTSYTRSTALYEDYAAWVEENASEDEAQYFVGSLQRFGIILYDGFRYLSATMNGKKVKRGILLKEDGGA